MSLTEVHVFDRALSRLGTLRLIVETAQSLTSATAANPVVVTKAAHGYANGDLVLVTGMAGLTQVNGRVFEVASRTANDFQLRDEDGSAALAAGTGGFAAKITATKAARSMFDAWRGSAGKGVRDEVFREHPWNCLVRYRELARLDAAKTITDATAANPVVLTSAAHGYVAGDRVLLENVGGMVELNDRFFTVASPTTNTFALAGEDGSAYAAYTSGGTAKKALTPLRPPFGFSARYDLPSDFERLLEIDGAPVGEAHELVGRELYCDVGPTAPIRYCRRELDPTRWDAGLVCALEARLAMECAEELSTSTSKAEKAAREYELHLRRAKSADAQEGSPAQFAEDPWVTARW